MEAEVKDGIFDDLIIMVDIFEVMKSSLLYDIISFHPVDRVEMRDLQSEDVDSRCFEHEFILRSDSCFVGIEESNELSV
jgi:hypothetical protein